MDNRNSNYLAHYGVLGMRWGVRKRRKDSLLFRQSSRQTRGIERRLKKNAKLRAKGKTEKYNEAALQKDYAKSKAFDKKVQQRVAGQSGAKTLAQAFLMGSRGALRYNQLRATGHGRLLSAGGAWASNFLRNTGMSTVANIAVSASTHAKYKHGTTSRSQAKAEKGYAKLEQKWAKKDARKNKNK